MSQVNTLNSICNANIAPVQPAAGSTCNVKAEQKLSGSYEDKVSVKEAVRNINAALTAMRRDEQQFRVDEDLGRLVVRIVNADTKELIRQIPTEEALELSKKMQEMVGLLF